MGWGQVLGSRARASGLDVAKTRYFSGTKVAALLGAATTIVTLAAAAPAGAVVLYDQYNNQGAAQIDSQDFEPAYDPFDAQAADDFVVPAGQTWNVNGVDVDGQYSGGGPAASVHVYFYANGAGNLPAAPVATRLANPYTPGPAAGDFVITLTSPVTLAPGTYWVSVQARQDFTPAGTWTWRNRTVLSNSGSAYQNPGNGFGSGCTSWRRRTACPGLNQTEPDQAFRINGTMAAAPPASPPPPPASPAPTAPPPPASPADTTRPALSSVSLSPRRFAVASKPTALRAKAPKGTKIKYTLSEPASVKIVIAQRRPGRRKGKRCVAPTRTLNKAKKCTRITTKGTLTRAAKQGPNSVEFSGRIGSRKLSPGSYQATLSATDPAKNSSPAKTITFTIVKA